MDTESLIEYWKQEAQNPFTGWDFSYLKGRMVVEEPPWSYTARAAELMRRYSSVIDMGTGGGETFLQLKAEWPQSVTVTEDYPPNFELAKKRLQPLGVRVVDVKLTETDSMPFENNEFGLVINRHSGFNPQEVARILAQGGVFLTQQVHGLSGSDLIEYFECRPSFPEATPEHFVPLLKAAGLTISVLRDWSGKLSFTDIAALVFYLKAVPWTVPGFSVETHSRHLLSLQNQLESGRKLVFSTRRYLIEARK